MRIHSLIKILVVFFILIILFIPCQAQDGSLLWNTFLGSSGSDYGYGIATDSSGNIYVTGRSSATWGSPVRAYNNDDAFVAKLDSSGTLLWNTFLGGSGSDEGIGIATDSSGNIYVTGRSSATWGSPVRAHSSGSDDAFVAKLDSSGTLLWNTFLGGSRYDCGRGIATDSSGNIYVTGLSDATWGSPIRAHSGGYDVFVARLNSSGTLLWNTFLGGSGHDESNGIALDSSGNSYVTGYSYAAWGSPVRAYSYSSDAFVARLNSSGTLLWNTFLGGFVSDYGYGIALDGSGNSYVTGFSTAAWGSPVRAYTGSADAFVARLDSSGTLLWNTFLGGLSIDDGFGIATDSSGNIYVTGQSNAAWGSPIRAHSGGYDVFVARLNSSGTLLWNTFLGGSGHDESNGIALDSSGNIYVTGRSSAAWGSPVRAYSSGDDAFVAKLYQTPLTNYYYVDSTVTGEGGSVDKKHRRVEEGDNVKINIFPDEGYEIDKIYDNGVEMTVANPYVIKNIREDHRVEITFKRILYPPVLSLTGERKTEKAWIIKKDYTELNISITEDEYPMVVAAYTLFKKVNGTWVGIKNFSGPGSYEYTEKFIKSGESVSYKLAAIAPDGTVISESTLTL